MWKMPAKERIQTRIVSASAVKRVLDLLSVCTWTIVRPGGEKDENRSSHWCSPAV